MLFIYWGWDTAVSINEETKDKNKTPGRAAILSTVLLLVTYAIVIVAVVAFAGIGTKGIGLNNPANTSDVLSVLGGAIFGGGGFGTFLTRLLILMVLSSAAASTQTTILPTARTTLSMAAYKALPDSFSKIHPKYLTPTVSTIVMGAISIALYVPMNYISGGNVIPDAVTAIGLYIAFYYGLTAFTCVWYYRRTLTSSARNLWMQGILPGLGGLLMYAFGGWSLWEDYDVNTGNSYTSLTLPGLHWQVGGTFVIAFLAALAGVHRLRLHAGHRARVLPEADADQGHAHAGPRPGRVARPRRPAGPPRRPGRAGLSCPACRRQRLRLAGDCDGR